MPVVTVGSVKLVDAAGDVKSIALYFPATATAAEVSLYMQEYATLLDAVVDAKIAGITVSLGVTLPGGLKAAAVVGNAVHVGALIAFDVDQSNYSHSIFVPSWKNAGFAGKSVVRTGAYLALTAAMETHTLNTTIGPASEEGEDLVVFLEGSYRVRK